MKQIKFKDKENNEIHGGIMMNDGSILCGCCGGLITADEVGENGTHEIIEVFNTWVNLDDEILGRG